MLCFTPCSLQKVMNAPKLNSPPQSVLNAFKRQPDSTSAASMIFLKYSRASSFVDSNSSHIYRLKSSTIKIKYDLPPGVGGVICPHKSPWTNSSPASARYDDARGNGLLCCLPSTHLSHTYSTPRIWGIPFTISFAASYCSDLKFRCPYLACQSHATSSILDIRQTGEVSFSFITYSRFLLSALIRTPRR